MLGASLMTFFEFIDVFVLLLYNQFLRLYKQKNVNKHVHMINENSVEENEELIDD